MPDDPGQPLDYARPGTANRRPSFKWIPIITSVFLLVGLTVFMLLPNPYRGERSPVVKCASNLRTIGEAILLYGMDYNGQYPPDLGALLLTQEITSQVMICPDTNDSAATGPTTQAVVAKMKSQPGHLSYIYIGAAFNTKTVLPTAVVAYEALADHSNMHMNVLFGDGHVEFIEKQQAKWILSQAAAGASPIDLNNCPPTTQPLK